MARGIVTVCSVASGDIALYLPRPDMKQWFIEKSKRLPPQGQLSKLLERWTATSEKATVLFINEIDALVGDTLISVLRCSRDLNREITLSDYKETSEELVQSRAIHLASRNDGGPVAAVA